MNEQQTQRTAQAVNAIRPDWPTQSLVAFITKHGRLRDGAWLDVTVALTYVACDPATKTPARVLEAGPWWHVGNHEPEPAKAMQCPRCRDLYPPHLAGEHRCTPPTTDARHHLAEARKALGIPPKETP